MTVECVYCGQANLGTAAICERCGRTLPPRLEGADAATPSWGSPDAELGARPPSWPTGVATPWAPLQHQEAWSPVERPGVPVPGAVYGTPQPTWPPGAPPWSGPLPFDVAHAQTKAKAAMICGIIGMLCLGINMVLGPIALGLGLKSRAVLQRYGVVAGQGMALAGIVLGTIDILFALLYLLSLLAR